MEQALDVGNFSPEPIIPTADPLIDRFLEGFVVDGKDVVKTPASTKDGVKIPRGEVVVYELGLELGPRDFQTETAYDDEGPLVPSLAVSDLLKKS